MRDRKINIYSGDNDIDTIQIVRRAFQRSFTLSQVNEHNLLGDSSSGSVLVFVNPGNTLLTQLRDQIGKENKIIIFGKIEQSIAKTLNLQRVEISDVNELDMISSCGSEYCTETKGYIEYTSHSLARESPLEKRPLCRFDFTNEWNNLGYGRIRIDKSLWGLGEFYLSPSSQRIANLKRGNVVLASYISLIDFDQSSILWCSRSVGPIDSLEWMVIERFISDYRPDLPCIPYLIQTPKNCAAVVTMRLDCDEDIASARSLFNLYKSYKVPLSLAVKTSLPMTPEHVLLIQAVQSAGGSILSHTHDHLMNWGADYDQAFTDASSSRNWFLKKFPECKPPEIAVSPFHTNPPYAMQALHDAGFTGVVGGIIHSDPEYLVSRAGIIPFVGTDLVTISQQSMLHGNSFRNQNHGIEVHLESLKNHMAARGIFGYLDHPFSQRYWYGWESEEQRIQAHKMLLDFINQNSGILFLNQQECFEFVHILMKTSLSISKENQVIASVPDDQYILEYRFHGRNFAVNSSLTG